MATTRIMPLHVGKGRTESRAISDIIDYVAYAFRRSTAFRVPRKSQRRGKDSGRNGIGQNGEV